jgi:cytochrome c-type biogenesis protein CcmH
VKVTGKSWFVAIACGLAILVPVTRSLAADRASLPDVEDEVMCTICGTLLAESDSPQAERERALIRRLIARGEDKEEIKDALVAQYGRQVLATPGGEGFDLLAWLVPGIGIAIALGGIALAVSRQRRRGRAPPEPAAEPSSSELAELERDMSSYDV